MNINQFSNLSCYEEFEIQATLTGISKVDVLKNIGHRIGNYYFFISNDGIFNWFDLDGNHVKDPCILKNIRCTYIQTKTTITKYVIPNSVLIIGYGTFTNCKLLKEIIIPNSVTHIDDFAFLGCESLKEIIIPNSVISIGSDAFYYCKSLTSITIPNNIINMGMAIFSNCISLKEVIFKGKTLEEVKQMENYPFGIKDESIIKCEIKV
jgi:hypothetical protein